MKYRAIFILALALLLPLGYGCDNDNNSNAEPPPGGEEPMDRTQAVGTVDASGEGCMGIDGLEAGDTVVLELSLTAMSTGDVVVTNFDTGQEAKCDMGFIQQEKNMLPANILCLKITDSSIAGLADDDRLEIGIVFSTDLNQLTVINGNTMDYVNITMTSLNAS